MECSPTSNVEMEKVAVADVAPEAVIGSADASVVVTPLKVSEMLTVPVRLPACPW